MLSPKSLALFAVACLTFGVSHANAGTILVDLSDAASVTNPATDGKYWNSVGGNVANLIDSTGAATTVDIAFSFANSTYAGFGGTGIDGPTGLDPFDEANAVIDGIFSNKDAALDGTATITLSGLEVSTGYNFSMIGGRVSNFADGVIAVTTGTGTGGDLLNDGTVLDLTITSNASGEIAFTFVDADDLAGGDSNAATFNAMSITQVPEPSSLVLLGLGGLLITLRRRRRG